MNEGGLEFIDQVEGRPKDAPEKVRFTILQRTRRENGRWVERG